MIFYSLLFVVLLSPLPLGLNRPWAWSLWALLVALLTIIWSLSILFKKNSESIRLQLKTFPETMLVFIAVLGWIIVQSFFHPTVSLLHPLWSMTADALNLKAYDTWSLTPYDSVTAGMRLLSYALTFWLAFYYGQRKENARLVFQGLMISGLIYSVYGLIIQLGGFNMILWFDKPYTDVSGTFINRNHFATYAGITLLCAFAMLTAGVNSSSKYCTGGNLGLQRFLENLIVRTWFPLLSFFVIGTALLLTHSRGGFFSTALSLIIMLCVLNINRRSRNHYLLLIMSAAILIGGLVFYVSSDGLLDRLDSIGLEDEIRSEVYDLTWSAIQGNLWAGFGLGSFEEVFPLYKSLSIAGNDQVPVLWDYAHNTYLECIFELGFPAAIGLFYCFFRMALICLIGVFNRKKDWIYPATGLAATCLISAHSTVDFSMQIPALPFTYMLLMGVACAQSFGSAASKQ